MSMLTKSSVRPAILHKIRQIAGVSRPEYGYQAVSEVDAEMGSLVLQGYRLVSTHFLGTQTDHEANIQYTGILYIFQLEPGEIEKLKKEMAIAPDRN